MSSKPQTKTFGKSTREVPASADKAKKWYNAEDEPQAKDVSCSLASSEGLCLFSMRRTRREMGQHAIWEMGARGQLRRRLRGACMTPRGEQGALRRHRLSDSQCKQERGGTGDHTRYGWMILLPRIPKLSFLEDVPEAHDTYTYKPTHILTTTLSHRSARPSAPGLPGRPSSPAPC